MRFGLVGTGYWAEHAHAAGIMQATDAELAGVWGRSADRAGRLAHAMGVPAYSSVDALIDDVDAVAMAVPPDVQAELAVPVARKGRHLLLDKPIAFDHNAARSLEQAVADSGVASVVFFTSRFQPEVRSWLDGFSIGDYDCAAAEWLGAAFAPGSPYADSPWRRERGGLWDVGPHALSVLLAALGQAEPVSAVRGPRGTTHLVCRHEGGRLSASTLSIDAPPSAAAASVALWGSAGRTQMPAGSLAPDVALAVAVDELVKSSESGTEHPCAVPHGRAVVDVLAAAERLLTR